MLSPDTTGEGFCLRHWRAAKTCNTDLDELIVGIRHSSLCMYVNCFLFCFVAEKRRAKGLRGTESGRRKRYSYKLPQEYNVETVVVADPAMVSYHGADAARRFILTILNMVGKFGTF